MTKAVKIVLLVAALAVVCGLGIGCLGYFWPGRAAEGSEQYTAQTRAFAAEGVTAIETELDVADIEVYAAEGDEIILDYFDSKSSWYKISEEGGVLKVSHTEDWTKYVSWNWQTGGEYYTIRLGLPQAFSGGLELGAASGKISVFGISLPGGIKLAAASGDIKAEAVSCGSLEIGVASGSMSLSGISATGDISVAGDTGKLTVQQVQCEAFNAKLTTGDVEADALRVTGMDIHTETGKLELEELTCGGPVNLETTTGRIRCALTDAMENYSITCESVTGSSNLPERSTGGEKVLEVRTTTGDIDFSFAE